MIVFKMGPTGKERDNTGEEGSSKWTIVNFDKILTFLGRYSSLFSITIQNTLGIKIIYP